MSRTLSQSHLNQRPTQLDLRLVWSGLGVILLLRLSYAWMAQLVPDEAIYWVWSRHLSTGYFDHPPMVAYFIWLGVHAVGATELGVRLSGVLLSVGATIVIVLLARRLLRDDRSAAWVGVMWLVSPLMALTGLLATPDMPGIFFSVCALACAALIAERDDGAAPRASGGLWLLFGLFSGLGLASKYTTVLLPAGVGLAMIASGAGRRHFRRPWIYLAAVVCLLVFAPVIWWNWQHHWASFLFQLHHGGVADEQAPKAGSPAMVVLRAGVDLSAYVGGQALLWTPILFGVAILVLAQFWRRYRRINQVDRVLLWSGTLPLVFFAVMYLRSHRGEINWPGFAYVPISILIGRWLGQDRSPVREGWIRGGCQVALAFSVALYLIGVPPVTRAILRLPLRTPHAIKDLVGHDKAGRELARLSAEANAPIICNHYQDCGEAAFYIPGQPEVWCVGIGARPTCFDYFANPPDFARMPWILWDGGHADEFCAKYGFHIERTGRWTDIFGPKATRTLRTFLLVRNPR